MRQPMVWPMLHNDTPRGRTDHGMACVPWNMPHGTHPGVCHGVPHRAMMDIFPIVQLTILYVPCCTTQLTHGHFHSVSHGRPTINPLYNIPRPNHGACHCLPHGMCHGAFPWQVQWNPPAHWAFHDGAHGISHVHTVHTMAYIRHDLPWCIS